MSYLTMNRRFERLILTHFYYEKFFFYEYYLINNIILINEFFFLFFEFLLANWICFYEVVACLLDSTAHDELEAKDL